MSYRVDLIDRANHVRDQLRLIETASHVFGQRNCVGRVDTTSICSLGSRTADLLSTTRHS